MMSIAKEEVKDNQMHPELWRRKRRRRRRRGEDKMQGKRRELSLLGTDRRGE